MMLGYEDKVRNPCWLDESIPKATTVGIGQERGNSTRHMFNYYGIEPRGRQNFLQSGAQEDIRDHPMDWDSSVGNDTRTLPWRCGEKEAVLAGGPE